MEKNIRIYHTHIEVFPYMQGENEKLERMLSIWIDAEFKFDPIGYVVYNDTLYVPRGFDVHYLEKMFGTHAYTVHTPDEYRNVSRIKMLVPPRDNIQEKAIDFLVGRNEFGSASSYSQQALILDTGIGKTYTTIHAIVELKSKAIIISHQDKIKKQWMKCFTEYTNVKTDDLVDIAGTQVIDNILRGKIEGSYYFINHQTITSYMKQFGPDAVKDLFRRLEVGIKVFDEAHLSFKNVLRTDFFSNTKRTFYLTANFDRSDEKEARLFKKVFNSVYKITDKELMGNSPINGEKRKHIVFIPVMYRSNPNINHLRMASNAYGFSVLGFFKYAFHLDPDKCMLRTFYKVFDMVLPLEGKLLITLPRIEDTYLLKEFIHREYPLLEKTIGTINSKNDKEANEYTKEKCDIIISTIRSCGTGVDIKGLRAIINLEPFSSGITANQLSGRLREYSPTDDTYFFHLVDLSFPTCERQYNTVLRHLKKKCKEVKILKI